MGVELKVLVDRMSAPALRYSRWMVGDHFGLRQRQNIVVSLQVVGVAGKQLPPEVLLGKVVILDQRPHGPVQHQHAVFQFLVYLCLSISLFL